jgi:hypothetical protein
MMFLLTAASAFVALSGRYEGGVRLAAVSLAAGYAYTGLGALGAARRT